MTQDPYWYQQNPAIRHLKAQFSGRPVVTYSIVGICVVIWLLHYLIPSLNGMMAVVPALGLHQPWRLITNGFAHTGLLHILFNMFAIAVICPELERMLGRLRFAVCYLVTVLGGSAGFILISIAPSASNPIGYNWYAGAIGASGAVFGMFGMYIGIQGIKQSSRSLWILIGLVMVTVFFTDAVAWQSHLGGLLSGLALGWWISRNRHDLAMGRSGKIWSGVAVITVVLLAAIGIRTAI